MRIFCVNPKFRHIFRGCLFCSSSLLWRCKAKYDSDNKIIYGRLFEGSCSLVSRAGGGRMVIFRAEICRRSWWRRDF